jgi:hypothetical protein
LQQIVWGSTSWAETEESEKLHGWSMASIVAETLRSVVFWVTQLKLTVAGDAGPAQSLAA